MNMKGGDIKQAKILVVDDDYDVLKSAMVLLRHFYSDVIIEQVPENVIERIQKERFDLILLDMNFRKGKRDGEEGLNWLKQILTYDPDAVVVMITAFGDLEIAVRAIRSGAVDFVLKPWKNQKLLATINSAISLKQTRNELLKLRLAQKGLVEESSRTDKIIGESPLFMECLRIANKVAGTEANVLITGENGTGKELIARHIHRQSERKDNPFIGVDLGSLSENLFESELFGHVRGAFTDAKEDKPGRFELASGGSIFLDEIGNLSHGLQAKLLAAIQNKSVYRVGSTEEIRIDFRLIAASNKSLAEMADRQEFREDLLYRINTVEIPLPSLRERPEDIEPLFRHYLEIYKRKYGKNTLDVSSRALDRLLTYAWPGNIRELQHMVERAVILNDNKQMGYNDVLPGRETGTARQATEILSLEEMEKEHLLKVIGINRGNITRAAKDLGISRTALHRRIKKYGI